MQQPLVTLLVLAACLAAPATATGPKGSPKGGLLNTVTAPITNTVDAVVNATVPAVTGVVDAVNQTVANVTAPILNATTINTTNTTGNLTAASGQPAVGVCARQCVRREWRSLSAAQRAAFMAAVRQLRTGAAPNAYDRFVKQHLDASNEAHGSMLFLPWHRAYLRAFEAALQAIDPTVCLPYWNSALDSQAPELSPLLTSDAFGSTTRGCVQNGLGQYQAFYPTPHCVSRQYDGGDVIGSFHSIESVNRLITGSSSFSTFSQRCEGGVHPVPHMNIGGDLSTHGSPNDALFWLHHGYIDMIWATWQRRNGMDYSGDRSAALPTLPGYTVDAVLDSRRLCYTYAELSNEDLADDRLPPAAVPRPPEGGRPEAVEVVEIPSDENVRFNTHDRTNIGSLRPPPRIPDSWLSMNRLDISVVRGYEDECRTLYRQLNSIKGYLSPCCLWKRPSLCRNLVGKADRFCVDVSGYGRLNINYQRDIDPAQCLANVRQKAVYCSPDVELPPEAYRAEIQKLVGASAFDGAGSMIGIVKSMDDISSATMTKGALMGAAAAVALVPALFELV